MRSMILAVLLTAASAACGADDGDGATRGSGKLGGEDFEAAIEAYASVAKDGTEVVCGKCWKKIGHDSEASCRMEAHNDELSTKSRACLKAAGEKQPAEVTLQLQCGAMLREQLNACLEKACEANHCFVDVRPDVPAACSDDGGIASSVVDPCFPDN